MHVPLFLAGIVELGVAVAFAFVGRATWKRPVGEGVRRASLAFATWWIAISVLTGIDAAVRLLGAFHAATPVLLTAQIYVALPALCLGLAGLLYYFVFVLTGSTRALSYISVYYGSLYVACLYWTLRLGPVTLAMTDWNVHLVFTNDPAQTPTWILSAALLGPLIVTVLAYSRLYTKVEDATQRYRIAMSAGSIFVWVVSVIVSGASGGSDAATWAVIARLMGVAAAAFIMLAYVPPAWIKRRYQVVGLRDDVAA